MPFDIKRSKKEQLHKPSFKRLLKTVDRVIHLAAYVSAPESIQKPDTYWKNNVEGTRIVAEFEGPLFFASSAAVYDVQNPYAWSKKASENELEFRPETTIGRFFNVFGEGDEKSVVYHFITKALKNQNLTIYGSGDQTRSFIYVKDLVSQIGFSGSTYDIGYPNSITIRELAKFIITLCDSRSKIIYDTERPGDPFHSQSKSRIKKYPYGFMEGLRRTIDYIDRTL